MSYSIFLVDDSPIIRRLLRHCIEHEVGWNVCGEAENGKTAVEKVSELKPDLVVLDWQMPVMDGLEAARRIALVSPRTTVIMFTWHTGEHIVREARAKGVRHILSKTDNGTKNLLALLRSFPQESPA